MKTLICGSCQSKVDESNYCPHCGASLKMAQVWKSTSSAPRRSFPGSYRGSCADEDSDSSGPANDFELDDDMYKGAYD